jgi:DNA-directed RNA polymerase subunit beta'
MVDCETLDGIEISPLLEAGKVIETVADRVLGRVALIEVRDHLGNIICDANQMIDEEVAHKIDQAGIERISIRSVLTCQAPWGICSKCYGLDLARGHEVNIGEAVGVIAAQSIGEPGTQLTMRTFHIGGVAAGQVEQSTHITGVTGKVKFINLNTVEKKDGSFVAMNRHGEIAVVDDTKREVEKFPILYGAEIKVKDGQQVKPETVLVEWDPHSSPILTEVDGKIKFGDVLENVTMAEQVDERTGFSRKVIIISKNPDLRPRISIKDPGGKTLKLPNSNNMARHFLPVGVNVVVEEGNEVSAGDIIAKIPRETTKTKDITGGLPRVAELFEARKPKELAIISEIEGFVKFGPDTKGKRALIVNPEVGEPKEYLVPKGKPILVHEGDFVRAGEPLMEGSANPHDILRVLKEKELAKYLVDEVQQVYRLQGVRINDKHIEAIVRQMLKKVKVVDPGGTEFLAGDQVDKAVFNRVNAEATKAKKEPATAEPLLLGITKASLTTESFISAASFQETTRVLTEASIAGKIDHLRGLKENVIMGRLIPAGTGMGKYQALGIEVEELLEETEEAGAS